MALTAISLDRGENAREMPCRRWLFTGHSKDVLLRNEIGIEKRKSSRFIESNITAIRAPVYDFFEERKRKLDLNGRTKLYLCMDYGFYRKDSTVND